MIRHIKDPCAARPTNFELVWLDDQPLAVIDANPALPSPIVVGHITSDHLHTPRAISNASGTVTWTWAPVSGNSTSGGSNAFGDRPAQATGAPFNTRPFNLRFPGQYLDAESGLHYNYFRNYEPGTGRYIQSDPIGLDGGISTCGYALQNPGRFVDPTGEFAVVLTLCVVPGIGQVACAAAAAGTVTWACIASGTCAAVQNALRDVLRPRDFDDCENDAECDDKFTECLGTSLNDAVGGNFGLNRCMLCRDTCEQNGGSWPNRSHTGDRCDYWNFP